MTISEAWKKSCRAAQEQVEDASRLNLPLAQQLMDEELARYCRLHEPARGSQLQARQFAWLARLSAIRTANELCLISMAAAREALEGVKHFLHLPIDLDNWDVWSREARRQSRLTARTAMKYESELRASNQLANAAKFR